MRHFLLFFVCLFLNFASYATEEVENVHKPFLVSAQDRADKIQHALNESMKTEKGLLTGEKGLTPFFETEFAFFRLMACEGGIPETNHLFLMIESKIKEGWQLQKPIIPMMEEKNGVILSEQISYPLNLKTPKKTTYYEDKAYFTLLYEVSEAAKLVEIKKEIPFTACKDGVCKTRVVPFMMTLDRTNTYQTDVCALMMHEFQNVPTPPKGNELKASLNKIDDYYLFLKLEFDRDVSYLNMQIEEDVDWNIDKIEYKNNQGQILIRFSEKITKLDMNIKLLSSQGAFDLNLPVVNGVYVPLKPEISYLSILIAGLGLFFLSPIMLVFLTLKDTKKALKKQIIQIRFVLFGCAFLFAVCGYFFDGFKILFEVPKMLWIIPFALLVYLLIKPKIKMKWAVFIFLLWPKPYLLDVLYALDTKSVLIFAIFFVWAFLCYLPFKICQNTPKFFKEIKKVKQYPYLLRIPQVVMLCWLIVVGFGEIFFEGKSVQDFSHLKKQNKTIFVSVENGYCLSCLLNKVKLAYIQKTTDLILKNNLEILTLDTSSKEGKSFLRENHFEAFSYGLLYGEKVPYPIFLFGSVELEEWQKHLSEITDTSDINKHFISSKDGEH